MQTATPDVAPSPSRRRFLATALSLLGLTAAGAVTIRNVLRYLIRSPRATVLRKVYVAQLSTLPTSGLELVDLREKPLIIVPRPGEVPLALSLVCTHLGCKVHHEPDGTYWCPCHNGRFDSQGNVTGGPPPRPLPHYQVLVEGNIVYLELPEA